MQEERDGENKRNIERTVRSIQKSRGTGKRQIQTKKEQETRRRRGMR